MRAWALLASCVTACSLPGAYVGGRAPALAPAEGATDALGDPVAPCIELYTRHIVFRGRRGGLVRNPVVMLWKNNSPRGEATPELLQEAVRDHPPALARAQAWGRDQRTSMGLLVSGGIVTGIGALVTLGLGVAAVDQSFKASRSSALTEAAGSVGGITLAGLAALISGAVIANRVAPRHLQEAVRTYNAHAAASECNDLLLPEGVTAEDMRREQERQRRAEDDGTPSAR